MPSLNDVITLLAEYKLTFTVYLVMWEKKNESGVTAVYTNEDAAYKHKMASEANRKSKVVYTVIPFNVQPEYIEDLY